MSSLLVQVFCLLLIASSVSSESRFLQQAETFDEHGCSLLYPTWATLLYNFQSNYQLEPALCDSTVQLQNNYHSWCIHIDANGQSAIWSTVREKYLGLQKVGSSYVITLDEVFDSAAHLWFFNSPNNFADYHQIYQYKEDVGSYFVLRQAQLDFGMGLPHAIEVDLIISQTLPELTPGSGYMYWKPFTFAKLPPASALSCVVSFESSVALQTFLNSDGTNLYLQYVASGVGDSWAPVMLSSYTPTGRPFYCFQHVSSGKYLSLDGNAGTVTLSATCGTNEAFSIDNNDTRYLNQGTIGLESQAFPNNFVNLDGSGIQGVDGATGGRVMSVLGTGSEGTTGTSAIIMH